MNISLNTWINTCQLPRLEARLLLMHVCGVNQAYLITHADQLLSTKDVLLLNQLCERRLHGEPMAYILGYREFYGRSFVVGSQVLIPRPETEHVVDAVLDKIKDGDVVWDLGTGSGAIAISVACEKPQATVWASDISQDAIVLAKRNAQHHQAHIHFGVGSWFEASPTPPAHSVAVVVANPPYIESGDEHLNQGDLRYEPMAALTDFGDGLTAIRTLISGAHHFLLDGGWIILEHGYQQGDVVRSLLKQHRFSHVSTIKDYAGLDRVSQGQRLPE